MKIKLIKDCEVEVAVGITENDEPIYEPTLFKKGEILEVEVEDFGMTLTGLRKDLPLLSFGDGTLGVFSTETFEILEGQKEFDEAYEDMKV